MKRINPRLSTSALNVLLDNFVSSTIRQRVGELSVILVISELEFSKMQEKCVPLQKDVRSVTRTS